MHLVKAPSGIYHFRCCIDSKKIWRSLRTSNKRKAQPLANKLYKEHMKKKIEVESREEIKDLSDFSGYLDDGTTFTITNTDPEKELELGLKALNALRNKVRRKEGSKNQESIEGNPPDSNQKLKPIDDFSELEIDMDIPEEQDFPTSKPEHNLQDLADEWMNDTEKEVTTRTQREREGALEAYMDVCTVIDQPSANLFSKILKKLPPGFKKKNLIKQSGKIHPKVLAPKTHNKYIEFMSGFSNWCVRRGYLPSNPFQGLKSKRTTHTHLERGSYTPEDIKLLLKESKLFPGFQYWLPRLALATGARINEISQLYKEDIITEDGLLCIRISNKCKGQHLKNLASHRIVPVHQDIRKEFEEYLNSFEHLRVFPGLTWTANSYYGGKASQWFNRWRKRVGLDLPFHSLRHTFSSTLLDKGVSRSLIDEILGHNIPGESVRYAGKMKPKILMEAIEKLDYL